jgi:hypothetical protein
VHLIDRTHTPHRRRRHHHHHHCRTIIIVSPCLVFSLSLCYPLTHSLIHSLTSHSLTSHSLTVSVSCLFVCCSLSNLCLLRSLSLSLLIALSLSSLSLLISLSSFSVDCCVLLTPSSVDRRLHPRPSRRPFPFLAPSVVSEPTCTRTRTSLLSVRSLINK